MAICAVAARRELRYEPERGLVRYLDVKKGEPEELPVPLDKQAIADAQVLVAKTAGEIRDRSFKREPREKGGEKLQCGDCDFVGLCGMPAALSHKRSTTESW